MRSILGEAVKLLAEDKIAAASQNATKLDKRIAANAKHQIPVSRQFSKSRIKYQRDRTLDAFGISSDRKSQNRKRASVRISEAKALRDAKPNAPNRYGPFYLLKG
ncbi:MAG: hypothetical protein WBW13_06420 [Pseudolabrys sp.]